MINFSNFPNVSITDNQREELWDEAIHVRELNVNDLLNQAIDFALYKSEAYKGMTHSQISCLPEEKVAIQAERVSRLRSDMNRLKIYAGELQRRGAGQSDSPYNSAYEMFVGFCYRIDKHAAAVLAQTD